MYQGWSREPNIYSSNKICQNKKKDGVLFSSVKPHVVPSSELLVILTVKYYPCTALMLKFHITYIIPDLHSLFKQFCKIKVSIHELTCVQCISHAHWQRICLRLCVQ